MNVQKRSKIGEVGEQMACDFLQTRGHQILDRNWRSGHLELDIVSEGPDGLHFVEVKARTAPVTTSVSDQVNTIKQKRISAAALQYLNKNHLDGKEVYFDIVSVLFDGRETIVRYFPQAWIPMYV
jgi:putative endonuclease